MSSANDGELPGAGHAAADEPPKRALVRDLLRWATRSIASCLAGAPAGSAGTPYLDALVLLAHATGIPTERLLAMLPDELAADAARQFTTLVRERCTGTPVSYIRGFKEFYGREFVVSPAVLVPRPETELLVEAALEALDASNAGALHLHDACTGSGCVAITLAAERPDLLVTASDVDEGALAVAATNRDRLLNGVPLELWRSDALASLDDSLSRRSLPAPWIITANPPYVTDTEYRVMEEAGWPEPAHALAAGPEGLAVIRTLARQAVTALPSGGYLILEIGADQGAASARILSQAGFSTVRVRKDLAGRDRVVVGLRMQ